eukprot:Pgem_evm1s13564
MPNTNKLCFNSCGSTASFNFPNEIVSLYCYKCKKEGMIDVKHRKCAGGCGSRASYNYAGETSALFCSKCKVDIMINVSVKLCRGNCGRVPSFNHEGETKGLYCSKCKRDDMINVRCPPKPGIIRRIKRINAGKCLRGCGTDPSFNYPQETIGLYCVKCKDQ